MAVAVGVAVAVIEVPRLAEGTTPPYSNAPISQAVWRGAGRGAPRWSVVTVQ